MVKVVVHPQSHWSRIIHLISVYWASDPFREKMPKTSWHAQKKSREPLQCPIVASNVLWPRGRSSSEPDGRDPSETAARPECFISIIWRERRGDEKRSCSEVKVEEQRGRYIFAPITQNQSASVKLIRTSWSACDGWYRLIKNRAVLHARRAAGLSGSFPSKGSSSKAWHQRHIQTTREKRRRQMTCRWHCGAALGFYKWLLICLPAVAYVWSLFNECFRYRESSITNERGTLFSYYSPHAWH